MAEIQAETSTAVVMRLLAEERRQRKRQEWRVRCYAEVLVLYAHRLATAQNKDPGKTIMEARKEVQTRIKEKGELDY